MGRCCARPSRPSARARAAAVRSTQAPCPSVHLPLCSTNPCLPVLAPASGPASPPPSCPASRPPPPPLHACPATCTNTTPPPPSTARGGAGSSDRAGRGRQSTRDGWALARSRLGAPAPRAAAVLSPPPPLPPCLPASAPMEPAHALLCCALALGAALGAQGGASKAARARPSSLPTPPLPPHCVQASPSPGRRGARGGAWEGGEWGGGGGGGGGRGPPPPPPAHCRLPRPADQTIRPCHHAHQRGADAAVDPRQ